MSSFNIQKIKDPSSDKAFLYSLRVLARREYSEAELRQKMKIKGFDREHIDEAIDQLHEKKFLCQERYMDYKIRLLIQKNYAIESIQRKLQEEGISVDQEKIFEFFENENTTEDEMIQRIIMKKKPDDSWRGSSPEAYKARSKVIARAMLKGHHYKKAQDILSAILHHLPQDEL